MKQPVKRILTAISVAALAIAPATSMAQTIALTPGTISSIAGVQGQTTNPANGTVASGNSIGAPYGLAIAPTISGAGGDIYFDNAGSLNLNLYVIYEGGAAAHAILVADGITSPVVGEVYRLSSVNETGPGCLVGLAVDTYGNVLVADRCYYRVYMYYAGTVSGQGTNPADALLTADGNAAFYGLHAGYSYHVADGSHIVGSASATPTPRDIYVDSAENIYFTDYGSNEVDLVYNATGTSANTILTAEGYTSLQQGYTYIIAGGLGAVTNDSGEGVVAYNGATNTATTGTNEPFGIGANPATGDIYFTDLGSLKIKKLSGSTAKLTTVGGPAAGTATTAGSGGDGGLATAAQIGSAGLHGLRVDAGGNIYFADSANNSIRKIDANGYVSTIAGTTGTSGSSASSGNATAATMNYPYFVAFDASGNLHIADYNNDLIHKVTVNTAYAGSLTANPVTNSAFAYEGNFAFGSVADNTQGATATALITNITASSLTPSSINIPFGYIQVSLGSTDVPDCSTSTAIPAGRSCTLALAFFPYQPISYSGNATVTASGQTVTIPVTGTGTAGATTTTTVATASNYTPLSGASVTLTGTVTPSAGTGRVSFWDNTTTFLGYGTMSGGVATYSTSSLALGSHSITAIYGGNGTYKNSTSSAIAVTVVLGTVATPTFSPAAGGYTAAQTVTISDSTSGATIHYTTDGTTPTAGSATYTSAITVSASETVQAIGIKSSYANSAVGSAAYTLTVATPTFSPAAGSYTSIQTVTISDSTSGAVIHYTTDGTTPTAGSTTYSSAITVSTSETVKAIAVNTGWTNSAVGSAAYVITLGGTYPVTDTFAGSGALSASWTNTLAGPAMSYPFVALVRSSSTVVPNKVALTTTSYGLATYTGAAFTADQYAQVKFVAHTASSSATGPCVIMSTAGTGYCYSADNGLIVAYSSGLNVGSIGITCPKPATGDTIQISNVGTTLTCKDVTTGVSASGSHLSGFYSSGTPGILVDQRNSALYAVTTFQADCVPTCVVPATPTFSPGGGSYGSTQTVTISDTTPSSTIYYTTNSTTPTTSSPVYSSPITVSYTETVQALAVAPGTVVSAVASATYVLQVATPTFSPAAGNYNSAQTVTISTASVGATIYYTTNGTTPTTGSTLYTGPITVSASETVKALGVLSGSPNSAIGSAAYVLQVATPTFSPSAGAYLSTQTVTISDTTPSSTIYYTTNGTTPTTSSTVYSSPITVSTTKTVKALATVASGYSNSVIGSALYTIGKTLSSIAISPTGGAIKNGSTLQFSATCTYSDSSTDDCTAAGGTTWRTSSLAGANLSVNSTGLVTRVTDPGTYNAPGNYVVVTSFGLSDKAVVYAQHAGDTWYQYLTPDYRAYKNSEGTEIPLNVAVGSTVTIGSAVNPRYANQFSTATPFQNACTWSTSDPSIATVDRHGQVTGVSPGSVTITCGVSGDAVFGSSTLGGWTSPGNTIALTVVAGGTSNTTWYVRPDGGTLYNATTNPTGQCNGQANQTYAAAGGSGTNQSCAVAQLRDLWDDNVTYYVSKWVIHGGDTVIVAQNSAGYNTGLDAQGGAPHWIPVNCAGNPYECMMPSIPSGTATRHTKILGANYASCHADSSKTLLHVSFGGATAFNVADSQFVDIACFEVTDEAACARPYTNNPCLSTDSAGDYGIIQSALTGSVNYTDLFIHGLADAGIYGASGVDVAADYLHLRANGGSGINMDDAPWSSTNISVAGGFTMTNSVTEFTGCVEEYPVTHTYPYIECQDQGSTGDGYGYGDGFGTASTTGDWIFDHDTWQYNFQDGLDLLHSGMQNLSVTNSLSLGNEGQTFKIGSADTVVFQNNIALNNCQRMSQLIGDEPASALYPGESSPGTLPALGPGLNGSYYWCRAGDGDVFTFTDIGSYKVQNNTFVGYAGTPFDLNCEGGWDSCTNAASAFQNNVVMGYSDPYYNTGILPGLFYDGSAHMPANKGWAVRDHNVYYNMRTGYCPTPLQTGETCTSDPMFVSEPASPISAETDLDNFNFTPASGSPLVGNGIAIPGITTDYNGTTRPNPPAIGAIQ